MDLIKGVLGSLKGSPYGKTAYKELFGAFYELFTVARRDGLLALDRMSTIRTKARSSTSIRRWPEITTTWRFFTSCLGFDAQFFDGVENLQFVRGCRTERDS